MPQCHGKVFFARFWAGLLITCQLTWPLPARAQSTLRPSVKGSIPGMEETLRAAGLDEETEKGERKALAGELGTLIASMHQRLDEEENRGKSRLRRVIQKIRSKVLFTRGGVTYLPAKQGKLVGIGDLHGDEASLDDIHEAEGDGEETCRVYVGDYVDVGSRSLEVAVKVLQDKLRNPERVVLLGGNHDRDQPSEASGNVQATTHEKWFFRDLKEILGDEEGGQLTDEWYRLMRRLPVLMVAPNGISVGHAATPSMADPPEAVPAQFRRKFDAERGLLEIAHDLIRDQLGWNLIRRPKPGEKEAEGDEVVDPAKHPRVDPETMQPGYWIGRKSYFAFLRAIGAGVFVRGHDRNAPAEQCFFDNTCLTVISTDHRSPDHGYPPQDKIVARYAVFDLAKSYDSIEPAEVVRYLPEYPPIYSGPGKGEKLAVESHGPPEDAVLVLSSAELAAAMPVQLAASLRRGASWTPHEQVERSSRIRHEMQLVREAISRLGATCVDDRRLRRVIDHVERFWKDGSVRIHGTADRVVHTSPSWEPRLFDGSLDGGSAVAFSLSNGRVVFLLSSLVGQPQRDGLRDLYPQGQQLTIPAGWFTYRGSSGPQERDVQIPSTHVDGVVNAVPWQDVQGEVPILLVDPEYLQAFRRSGAPVPWRRLEERGLIRVVEVDPSERHLNPANFILLPNGHILLNPAPRTAERLIRAGMMPDRLHLLPEPVVEFAQLGAGPGCLVGIASKAQLKAAPGRAEEESPAAGLEEGPKGASLRRVVNESSFIYYQKGDSLVQMRGRFVAAELADRIKREEVAIQAKGPRPHPWSVKRLAALKRLRRKVLRLTREFHQDIRKLDDFVHEQEQVSDFQRAAREVMARVAGIPPEQIVFLRREAIESYLFLGATPLGTPVVDDLIWDLRGEKLALPHRYQLPHGGFRILCDRRWRPHGLVFLSGRVYDLGTLEILAHEAAHFRQAPRSYFHGTSEPLWRVMAEWDQAEVETVLFNQAIQDPGLGLTAERKRRWRYTKKNPCRSYPMEALFRKEFERRYGREVTRAFRERGSRKPLLDALGPARYRFLRDFFRHWDSMCEIEETDGLKQVKFLLATLILDVPAFGRAHFQRLLEVAEANLQAPIASLLRKEMVPEVVEETRAYIFGEGHGSGKEGADKPTGGLAGLEEELEEQTLTLLRVVLEEPEITQVTAERLQRLQEMFDSAEPAKKTKILRKIWAAHFPSIKKLAEQRAGAAPPVKPAPAEGAGPSVVVAGPAINLNLHIGWKANPGSPGALTVDLEGTSLKADGSPTNVMEGLGLRGVPFRSVGMRGPAADPVGGLFFHLLKQAGIDPGDWPEVSQRVDFVPTMSVQAPRPGEQGLDFRFIPPFPEWSAKERGGYKAAVRRQVEEASAQRPGGIFAFTSRIPANAPPEFLSELFRIARERGMLTVYDPKEDTFADPAVVEALLREGPHLITPDLKEFSRMCGLPEEQLMPRDPQTLVRAARELLERSDRQSGIRMILISLDRDGALLIDRNRACYANTTAPVSVIGPGGAGDAGLAALMKECVRREALNKAPDVLVNADLRALLRAYVAGGSAAVQMPGDESPPEELVLRMSGQVYTRILPLDMPSEAAGGLFARPAGIADAPYLDQVWVPPLGRYLYADDDVLDADNAGAETFLRMIGEHPERFQGDILELGTGAAVLAIAMARGGAHVVACDISARGIRLAEENLRGEPTDVRRRVTLGVSDVYDGVGGVTNVRQFDAVVFDNPTKREGPGAGGDASYATSAGTDFDVIRRTLDGLETWLKPAGEAYLQTRLLTEEREGTAGEGIAPPRRLTPEYLDQLAVEHLGYRWIVEPSGYEGMGRSEEVGLSIQRLHRIPGRAEEETPMLPAGDTDYDHEDFLRRRLWELDDEYDGALTETIERMTAEQPDHPVRILFVGVGRGNEAIDAKRGYGEAVEIVAINKKPGEFYDTAGFSKELLLARGDEARLKHEAAFRAVRARLRIADVEAPLPADLVEGRFDIVAFGRSVTMYLADKVEVMNRLLRDHVREGGYLFASATHIRVEGEQQFSSQGYFKEIAAKDPRVRCFWPQGLIFQNSEGLQIPLQLAFYEPTQRGLPGVQYYSKYSEKSAGTEESHAAGQEEFKVGEEVWLDGRRGVVEKFGTRFSQPTVFIRFDHPTEFEEYMLGAVRNRLSRENPADTAAPTAKTRLEITRELIQLSENQGPASPHRARELLEKLQFLSVGSLASLRDSGELDRMIEAVVRICLDLPAEGSAVIAPSGGAVRDEGTEPVHHLAEIQLVELVRRALEPQDRTGENILNELRPPVREVIRSRRSRGGRKEMVHRLEASQATVRSPWQEVSEIGEIQRVFQDQELELTAFPTEDPDADAVVLSAGARVTAWTRLSRFSQSSMHTHVSEKPLEVSDRDDETACDRARYGISSLVLRFDRSGEPAGLRVFEPTSHRWELYTGKAEISDQLRKAGFLSRPAAGHEEPATGLEEGPKGASLRRVVNESGFGGVIVYTKGTSLIGVRGAVVAGHLALRIRRQEQKIQKLQARGGRAPHAVAFLAALRELRRRMQRLTREFHRDIRSLERFLHEQERVSDFQEAARRVVAGAAGIPPERIVFLHPGAIEAELFLAPTHLMSNDIVDRLQWDAEEGTLTLRKRSRRAHGEFQVLCDRSWEPWKVAVLRGDTGRRLTLAFLVHEAAHFEAAPGTYFLGVAEPLWMAMLEGGQGEIEASFFNEAIRSPELPLTPEQRKAWPYTPKRPCRSYQEEARFRRALEERFGRGVTRAFRERGRRKPLLDALGPARYRFLRDFFRRWQSMCEIEETGALKRLKFELAVLILDAPAFGRGHFQRLLEAAQANLQAPIASLLRKEMVPEVVEETREHVFGAGLEEIHVERWDDATSHSIGEELKLELKLEQMVDLMNWSQETKYYPALPPGSAATASHFRREWSPPGQTHAQLVQVGPLFFLDSSRLGDLSPALRAKLGGNLIVVEDMPRSHLTVGDFAPYTTATVAAMLQGDLRDKAVIDAGAGEGILSIVALRLGARSVELVENQGELVGRAGRNLRLNEYQDGEHFRLIPADLTGAEDVLSRLQETDLETVIISNIGLWGIYTASNADSIRLVAGRRKVVLFIGGGYTWLSGTSAEDDKLWPPEAEVDLAELEQQGFRRIGHADFMIPGEDHPQHIISWVAERSPAAGLEETPEETIRRILGELSGAGSPTSAVLLGPAALEGDAGAGRPPLLPLLLAAALSPQQKEKIRIFTSDPDLAIELREQRGFQVEEHEWKLRDFMMDMEEFEFYTTVEESVGLRHFLPDAGGTVFIEQEGSRGALLRLLLLLGYEQPTPQQLDDLSGALAKLQST